MNKNQKLLIMLMAAAAFIAMVVFFNEKGGQEGSTTAPGSDNFKLIKSKIDALEMQGYQDAQYKGLKLQIASYGKSKQITAQDSLNLISLLELSKSKSLVISFDDTENNNCMNTNALAKWTQELRKQETIIPYPEAQKRIQRYKHMVQFLAIGGYIIKYKKSIYDETKSKDYQSKINNMFAKPGVSGCPLANQKRSEWLSILSEFKNKHVLYLDYKSGRIKSSDNRKCEVFREYPAYVKDLNLQCPIR
jgi:hypothetical protein